jgi:hypothetical protein
MRGVSISTVWDDVRTFIGRERGLIFPVGFATFGVALLIMMMVVPTPSGGKVPVGPWTIWMIPLGLLLQLGYLTISAIALRPGISVREAIEAGLRRLPMAIVILFLLGLICLAILIASSFIVGLIGRAGSMALPQMVALASVTAVIPMIWVAVRFVLVWPLLIDRGTGPMETLRYSFQMTKGHAWKIAGVFMITGLVYMLLTAAVQVGAGTVLMLIARALGRPAMGLVLTDVLVSGAAAAYASVWTIFIAALYGRMSGSIRGI